MEGWTTGEVIDKTHKLLVLALSNCCFCLQSPFSLWQVYQFSLLTFLPLPLVEIFPHLLLPKHFRSAQSSAYVLWMKLKQEICGEKYSLHYITFKQYRNWRYIYMCNNAIRYKHQRLTEQLWSLTRSELLHPQVVFEDFAQPLDPAAPFSVNPLKTFSQLELM